MFVYLWNLPPGLVVHSLPLSPLGTRVRSARGVTAASTGVEFTPSKSSGVLCATIVTTPKSLTTVSKPEGSLAPCGLQWNSLVLRRRLFPNPLPILPARGLA